jgi:arginase family enzyme
MGTAGPRDAFKSPRFSQPPTFMRLPYRTDLAGVDVALIGIPFDSGTSYRPGARLGPREIRAHGPLGLVQFDSHIDTWGGDFGSTLFHGSSFYYAVTEGLVDPRRFVQVGIRGPMYGPDDFVFQQENRITVLDIDEVFRIGLDAVLARIRSVIGSGPVYITFDIDAVDPAFAPGTGTPEVGGLSSHQAQLLVRGLAGLSIVGGDIVEVSPPFDGPGQITSLLAANLLFELLCVIARAR